MKDYSGLTTRYVTKVSEESAEVSSLEIIFY